MHDVAVVGAGPSGAATAIECSRLRLDVILFEMGRGDAASTAAEESRC